MLEELYGNDLIGDPQTLEEEDEARSGALFWDEEREERNEGDTDNAIPDFDVSQTAPQGSEPVQPKKRKTTQNPQPKLDPERLKGPRGISQLENVFKDFKYSGKGYEKKDLNKVMKHLEHWAHRLFPKFQFDDCLEKLEILGRKKPVMTYVKRLRMGLETAETAVAAVDLQNEPEDIDLDSALPSDPFDDLLAQQISHSKSQTSPPKSPRPPKMALTEEQKERMRKNRLLAEERLLARLKASQQSKSTTTTEAPVGSTEPTTSTSIARDGMKNVYEIQTDLASTQNFVLSPVLNRTQETTMYTQPENERKEIPANIDQEIHVQENKSPISTKNELDVKETLASKDHEQHDGMEIATGTDKEQHVDLKMVPEKTVCEQHIDMEIAAGTDNEQHVDLKETSGNTVCEQHIDMEIATGTDNEQHVDLKETSGNTVCE